MWLLKLCFARKFVYQSVYLVLDANRLIVMYYRGQIFVCERAISWEVLVGV